MKQIVLAFLKDTCKCRNIIFHSYNFFKRSSQFSNYCWIFEKWLYSNLNLVNLLTFFVSNNFFSPPLGCFYIPLPVWRNSCFDNVLITVMKKAVISNQNVNYFVQILESSIKIKSSLKIKYVTKPTVFLFNVHNSI